MVLATLPDLVPRHWPWLVLALAAPVVVGAGWPVHRVALAALRRGRAAPELLLTAGGAAAVAAALHALLVGGAGEAPPDADATGPVALLAVVALGTAVALLAPASAPDATVGAVLVPAVLAVAVGTAGYALGAGRSPEPALAVLAVAAPGAVLLARRAGPPTGIRLRAAVPDGDTDPDLLLRTAAALLQHLDGPRAAAVAEAAGPGASGAAPLPGVSDRHGSPGWDSPDATAAPRPGDERHSRRIGTDESAARRGAASGGQAGPEAGAGVRGVVSELVDGPDGARVVAHAVLVGDADWLRAHGVAPAAGADGPHLLVAWDGVARGRLELGAAGGRGEHRAMVAAVAVTAAGVAAAAAGLLDVVGAAAVVLAGPLLVLALRR